MKSGDKQTPNGKKKTRCLPIQSAPQVLACGAFCVFSHLKSERKIKIKSAFSPGSEERGGFFVSRDLFHNSATRIRPRISR